MNSWELASGASKLLGLLATAGVTGGTFGLVLAGRQRMSQDQKMRRYVLASALLGLIAAGLFFLVQVGAVNQRGPAGMFDGLMISILATSGLGVSLALRVFGFACAVAAMLLLRGRARTAVLICTIAILAFSFSVTGHISTLSYSARAAIVLHVLAAFLWIGALYPLIHLSATNGVPDVKRLMRFFGQLAMYIVAVLILSGIFLLTKTLGSFETMPATPYGRAVMAKLSGVFVLLALAAENKLIFVPRLKSTHSLGRLQRSIRAEVLTAVIILTITAWLTTAIGPAH